MFGITLIGATSENARKLLLTLAFVVVAWLVTRALRLILGQFVGSRSGTRFQFWAKQGVSLVVAAILILGVMSIWFDNPARLAGALGLIGAGIAFALQRVITAVAGYFVILRGKTFNVGDRIVMGGVRGDVDRAGLHADARSWKWASRRRSIAGGRRRCGCTAASSPAASSPSPTTRCSTSRCTITRSDFPYIWEEMRLPVRYADDRRRPSRSCSTRRATMR